MSNPKQTGPAQPDEIDHQDEDRSSARVKDKARDGKPEKDDMPGADGFSSAGANEDTYD